MGKKVAKATRKFASSGQLKKVIQARHKHQQIRKKFKNRRDTPRSKDETKDSVKDRGEESQQRSVNTKYTKQKDLSVTVDELLDGALIDSGSESDETELGEVEMFEEQSDDDKDGRGESDDDHSFASVESLEEEGAAHVMELSKLAEKDPEFYKYLQENDRELLGFDPEAMSDKEEEEDGVEVAKEDLAPILTKETLRKWQKALLETRSLRALRALLIAFRSAAHMNEEDVTLAWRIESSSIYHKLVTTALRYTPILLAHHVPCKTLANGTIKPPTQTHKFKTLQKLILSYFKNAVHVLSQLTDQNMLLLAVTESAKILPYITSSRHVVKLYLKRCLYLWSSAEDSVRIAAFIAIKKLASLADDSNMDSVMKGIYRTFVKSCRTTSVHTLPSINFMKNSASELFFLNQATGYQHAFGYIRYLAIELRNSMKVKNKEMHRQVYNWQYAHCIDFWSVVLAKACDPQTQMERNSQESELKPLIYPLVQVSLGAIRLIPSSKYYPFHFHIIRSLLHLSKHTGTFIPVMPHLVPVITSTLAPTSKLKSSTLKPLNFEVQIHAPQQYLKTRVYSEGTLEEATFILVEWLSSPVVQGSIAFPEIILPIVVLLRKSLKMTKDTPGTLPSKGITLIKVLLERIEESARWIERSRKKVSFSPNNFDKVFNWEKDIKLQAEDSPLGKYAKVQKKMREKRQKLVEKAREGEDEILDEE